VTYAFNGDGLCVRQDDGVVDLETLYDGLNRVLEEDGGTVEADYTTTPEPYGNALSQHRSGDSSFYLWDGIRNVRQLTDGAEVVTDSYGFDGWGRSTGSSGSTANTQQWQGQSIAYRKDADAGPESQYAMHHRNYNPRLGVFTAADPAKDDLNLYRYVHNNPVNRDDPSGLAEIKAGKRTRPIVKQPPAVCQKPVPKVTPQPKEEVSGFYVWLYTGDWTTTTDVYDAATGAGGESYRENAKSAHQAFGALSRIPGAGQLAALPDKLLVAAEGRELNQEIMNGVSIIDRELQQSPELKERLGQLDAALPYLSILSNGINENTLRQLQQQLQNEVIQEQGAAVANQLDQEAAAREDIWNNPKVPADVRAECLQDWLELRLTALAMRAALQAQQDPTNAIDQTIVGFSEIAASFDRGVQQLPIAQIGPGKVDDLRQLNLKIQNANAEAQKRRNQVHTIGVALGLLALIAALASQAGRRKDQEEVANEPNEDPGDSGETAEPAPPCNLPEDSAEADPSLEGPGDSDTVPLPFDEEPEEVVAPKALGNIGELAAEHQATLTAVWRGEQPLTALPESVRQQLARLYSRVASENPAGFAQAAFNEARAKFLLGQGPNPGPSVNEFAKRMGIPVFKRP
jgi:RHS repeat-associated protein